MSLQRKLGRSTQMEEKTPGEHSITENREGRGFNWRQWSGGLNITESLNKSRSPLDRYTNIKVIGDPGQGHVCVHIKGLSKAIARHPTQCLAHGQLSVNVGSC